MCIHGLCIHLHLREVFCTQKRFCTQGGTAFSGMWELIPYVVEMVKVFNFQLLKLKGLLCLSHVLQWFYGKKNGATATMKEYKYTAANWDTRSRTRKNQVHRWFFVSLRSFVSFGKSLELCAFLVSLSFLLPYFILRTSFVLVRMFIEWLFGVQSVVAASGCCSNIDYTNVMEDKTQRNLLKSYFE